MIDNCAGAMVFVRGYDDNAVGDHDVQHVGLTTATGEAVDAATGIRSHCMMAVACRFDTMRQT